MQRGCYLNYRQRKEVIEMDWIKTAKEIGWPDMGEHIQSLETQLQESQARVGELEAILSRNKA